MRDGKNDRHTLEYYAAINVKDVMDESILNWADATIAEIEYLMALEGVDAATKAAQKRLETFLESDFAERTITP